MEREMPVEQTGFQKGRGTREHIANLRWLMEVSREYQKNVYLCFINYSKAFDCIDHNRLWLSLRSMGILEHLIVLMKNLYGDKRPLPTHHMGTLSCLVMAKESKRMHSVPVPLQPLCRENHVQS